MSKSLKRVKAALMKAGGETEVLEMPGETRTTAQAAEAAGCALDQIAKSIKYASSPDEVVLFITAGGRQVDVTKASALVGAPLTRADAAQIRAQTGFAIGGVSPVGLTAPVRCWFDQRLMDFAEVWPAAGTPRHVFAIDPRDLQALVKAQVADFTS